MYVGTAYNRVAALDADTGKEIWVTDIGNTPSVRGLAYWPGIDGIGARLVFGTSDTAGLLISLDAKTGAFAPEFGAGGKVDLRQGFAEKYPKLRVALSSPGTGSWTVTRSAGHSTGAMFPSARLRLEGAVREFNLQSEAGNTVTRVFCPACGSPILGRNTGMPGFRTRTELAPACAARPSVPRSTIRRAPRMRACDVCTRDTVSVTWSTA